MAANREDGSRGLRRPARRRLVGCSAGFTLPELVVAMALAAIGILATITVFDSSRQLVTRSERKEAAVHRAEREVERILSLGYDSIAHATPPTHSTDPENPAFYVTDGPPPEYDWDQGGDEAQSDPLVVAPGGDVGPATTWEDDQDRLSGTVEPFVTWVDDPCCAGTNDARRVTVAVTVDGEQRFEKPIVLSTIVTESGASGG